MDEAVAGSGATSNPSPGLAHGWTQGPMAEDATVLARTDVRGGGHRAASGCVYHGPLAEAKAAILAAVQAAVEE